MDPELGAEGVLQLVEISTSWVPKFLEIFLTRVFARWKISTNPLSWSWNMFEALFSTQGQVPETHLTTFPKIVLAPRKSRFPEWNMCLMCAHWLHRTPKISYSKKQEFSGEYFNILVCGVILRSWRRIEFGPNSNPKGKPGHPPLKEFEPRLICIWRIWI